MQRFQQIKHALGSEAILTICVEEQHDHESVFKVLWQYIAEFENRFSRFKEESELSSFNLRAGEVQTISNEFKDLLMSAKQYAQLTSGLYNPLILPSLQRAGYKGSWPTPQTHSTVLDFTSRTIVEASKIKINKTTARIPHNTALDFGGIGKGFALDKLAELLAQFSVPNFWLSLGGDIICSGFDLKKQTWNIGITHSENPEETIATVVNTTGTILAVATSGITKRRGKNWHHIIDPRTGNHSESDVIVATAVARSATAADIYAKCLVIEPETKPLSAILGTVMQHKSKPPKIIQEEEFIYAQYI